MKESFRSFKWMLPAVSRIIMGKEKTKNCEKQKWLCKSMAESVVDRFWSSVEQAYWLME